MEDKKMTREEFQKLIDQTLDEGMEEAVAWEMKKRDPIYDAMKDTYMEAFPTLSEKEAYETYMTLIQMRLEREEEARQAVFEETGIPPQEQRDREMMDKYGRKYINIPPLQDDIDMLNKHIIEKQKKDQELLDKLLKDDPDTNDNDSKPEEEQNVPENNDGDNKDNENNNSSNNWKWIALFAIFLLGIGGCFGGLIMKGSKDAATSSISTYSQEQSENQPEVTISQPKEEGNTEKPEEATPFWMIELVANTPASKTLTPEEAIKMGDEYTWYNKGKEYLRKGKSVYKLSSKGVRGEKLPLDIKIIETYTDFEDFFTDPERWYTEDLPGFAERYAKYVKALKEFDNGWVPDDQGNVYKEKGYSMRDTTYEDADLIYRFLLLKVAQIRQVFKIHKEVLLPLASQEIRANVNVNHKMYNSVEDYLGGKVKYKDTWWNRQNSNYKLEDFESEEMYKYVNELIKRYR